MDCPLPTTKNTASIQESDRDENFVGVYSFKTEEFDNDEFSSIDDPLEVSETLSEGFSAESNVEWVANIENRKKSTIKQFNQPYVGNTCSEKQPMKDVTGNTSINKVTDEGTNTSRVSVCSPLLKSENSVKRMEVFLVKKENVSEKEKHTENPVKRKYKMLHKCGKCEYFNFDKEQVLKHWQSVHKRKYKILHKCGECEYFNFDKEQVQKHWQSVHKGIELFKCSVCRDEFIQKGRLQMHMNKYHHEEKRHMCSICGKGFSHKGFLKGHIALTHEIKTQEYK